MVVAAPNRAHVPLARAAIAAGLPVVVDKPLAARAAEGRALARAGGGGRPHARGVPEPPLGRRLPHGAAARRGGRAGERPSLRVALRAVAPGDPRARGGSAAAPRTPAASSPTSGSHLIDQAIVLFGPVEVGVRGDRPADGTAPGDDDDFVALTPPLGVRSHLWMSHAAAQRGPADEGARRVRGLREVGPRSARRTRLRAGAAARRRGLGGRAARALGTPRRGRRRGPRGHGGRRLSALLPRAGGGAPCRRPCRPPVRPTRWPRWS